MKIEPWMWSLLARQKREGLPRLEGSEAQRAWAAVIREGALSELRLIEKDGNRQAKKAALEILSEDSASWWISNRALRGADLVRVRIAQQSEQARDLSDLMRKR